MKSTFSVKGWEDFQHYKDRNPPWIKLHNHLLDDYQFECLSDAAKGHLLCIWMLASRTKNQMPYDEKWIAKKIGASTKVDLESLVKAGFLIMEQDASTLLHNGEHDATASVPSEEKRRGETEESRVDINTSKFNFKNELLAMGVDKDILDDWMVVRQKKKSSNTKTAFNGLKTEVEKSGLSFADAVKVAAENSWSGFKAQWYQNLSPAQQAKSTHTFAEQNYTSGKF